MHPRISELLTFIEAHGETLRSAFHEVPIERRGTRPVPTRWSPAEVVHHVAIVERRLTARLQQLIEQARALEPERDTSPVLATINTDQVTVRAKRFTTSELGEPRDTDATRVWSDFEDTRRALKDVVATADGLALGAVSAPHPALGPLTGYEWIAFAGTHAARHADQIREDATTASSRA